jgi:hypothetical protein
MGIRAAAIAELSQSRKSLKPESSKRLRMQHAADKQFQTTTFLLTRIFFR